MNRKHDLGLFTSKSLPIILMGLVVLFLSALIPMKAVADTTQIDKTKQTLQDTGRESMDAAGEFISRVNESGVQNWTRDEIVAFLIIALLVGSAAGMFSSMKTTGLGRVGLFMLGLAGALAGCMVVRVGSIDHEWGELPITYEALVYSFGAAIVFIVIDRVCRRLMSKKKKKA